MAKDRAQFYSALLEKQEAFSLDHVEDQDMTTAPFSALEFFISLDLEPDQYEGLMEAFEELATRPHAPFTSLQGWLLSCSPPEEFMVAWHLEARVELQALMQHTAERIIEMNAADIGELIDSSGLDTADLTLISTWSIDSATVKADHSSSSVSLFEDNDILSAAVTPIQMIMNSDPDLTVWFNPMPQSIRFCRPIVLEYDCKDTDHTRKTKLAIEQEIANLKRIRVILPNGKFVHADFRFTLSLTEDNALEFFPEASKTGNCLICGATPDAMNKMEILEVDSKGHAPPYYNFTPLYVWVQFFEFLMEISFR